MHVAGCRDGKGAQGSKEAYICTCIFRTIHYYKYTDTNAQNIERACKWSAEPYMCTCLLYFYMFTKKTWVTDVLASYE